MAYKAAKSMEVVAPDLRRICGIALNGDWENNSVEVRDHQTFWLGAKTNLKGYNPTAPDATLPALADISAYLYSNHNTDPLIKAALVHYQFEMIHPFERYNGIVGRILVPMVLRDTIREAMPLICVSEYLYHNKNEYFDLLRSTQYSGGYVRWIKFFVNAVGQAAKQSAEQLMQYEQVVAEAEDRLMHIGDLPKSIFSMSEYLKRFPITTVSYAAKRTGLSFNAVSKAIALLHSYQIVDQIGVSERNRVWIHKSIGQI